MLVALLFLTAPPFAQQDPSLSDAQVLERLQFLERHLDSGTTNAKLWFGSWTAIYSGLGVGQGILALVFADREKRVSDVAGGVASFIGALSLAVLPMPAAFAAGRLEALPESTPEERRKKLAVAEGLLDRAADAEAFGRSWLQQTGAAVASLALGMILSLGYHYYSDAALDTFGGLVISQMQIITQPTQAVRDREDYARRFGLPPPAAPLLPFRFGVFPGGWSIAGVF